MRRASEEQSFRRARTALTPLHTTIETLFVDMLHTDVCESKLFFVGSKTLGLLVFGNLRGERW